VTASRNSATRLVATSNWVEASCTFCLRCVNSDNPLDSSTISCICFKALVNKDFDVVIDDSIVDDDALLLGLDGGGGGGSNIVVDALVVVTSSVGNFDSFLEVDDEESTFELVLDSIVLVASLEVCLPASSTVEFLVPFVVSFFEDAVVGGGFVPLVVKHRVVCDVDTATNPCRFCSMSACTCFCTSFVKDDNSFLVVVGSNNLVVVLAAAGGPMVCLFLKTPTMRPRSS